MRNQIQSPIEISECNVTIDPDIQIRRATIDDAEVLGLVGPAAYAEAYAGFWDNPAAYLAQLGTFGESAFRACLTRIDTDVWVAEIAGVVVGFLIMNQNVSDPVTRAPGGVELARLYVVGPARGCGVGEALFDAAMRGAANAGAVYVWLHAMKAAGWARRRYLRWGFAELAETRFEGGVRPSMAEMIIMARALEGTSAD